MFAYYPIEPYIDIVIISGQRVAQTRRVGKHNERAAPTKSAVVFALPNYVPFLARLALPFFKLTPIGGCRIQLWRLRFVVAPTEQLRINFKVAPKSDA